MEGPDGGFSLPTAPAVLAVSTGWRLTRGFASRAAPERDLKVVLLRDDAADHLLMQMPPGTVLVRSYTAQRNATGVFVSYRLKGTVHHQRVPGVEARWKLQRQGEPPRCLLDQGGIDALAALHGGFTRALSLFLRQVAQTPCFGAPWRSVSRDCGFICALSRTQVAAHRHFLDVEASALCLRLELQFREFLICRSGDLLLIRPHSPAPPPRPLPRPPLQPHPHPRRPGANHFFVCTAAATTRGTRSPLGAAAADADGGDASDDDGAGAGGAGGAPRDDAAAPGSAAGTAAMLLEVPAYHFRSASLLPACHHPCEETQNFFSFTPPGPRIPPAAPTRPSLTLPGVVSGPRADLI